MTENWHEDFEDEAIVPDYEQLTGEPDEILPGIYFPPVIEGGADPGEIRHGHCRMYYIVGNKNYAFAINEGDDSDNHYFDRDPDVNDDAFIRACGWAYEPED